ncbi:hypothetical protein NKG05_13825 [Oerskovia sp. M15]
MELTGGLALVVGLGVLGQVLAKSLRVPSILLLLVLGLLAGPVTGLVDPDALLGTRSSRSCPWRSASSSSRSRSSST